MKKIGLFLILLFPLCAMASPTVDNIRASQRENSKLVDILYDVAYSGSSNVSIMCEVSTNSGASYDVQAKSFSGDIGAMVPTGTDRLIVWNAGVDWDENYSEQVKVRITAKAPRFTDNGDGSITDNTTGLMWQKEPVAYDDPDIYGGASFLITWWSASTACATLGDGWRLPTVTEVETLLDTNNVPHLPTGHPFDVPLDIYWTADMSYVRGQYYDRVTFTPVAECFSLTAEEAVFTAPLDESRSSVSKWATHYVWPVRSAN